MPMFPTINNEIKHVYLSDIAMDMMVIRLIQYICKRNFQNDLHSVSLNLTNICMVLELTVCERAYANHSFHLLSNCQLTLNYDCEVEFYNVMDHYSNKLVLKSIPYVVGNPFDF